jgi:hypothetical protein
MNLVEINESLSTLQGFKFEVTIPLAVLSNDDLLKFMVDHQVTYSLYFESWVSEAVITLLKSLMNIEKAEMLASEEQSEEGLLSASNIMLYIKGNGEEFVVYIKISYIGSPIFIEGFLSKIRAESINDEVKEQFQIRREEVVILFPGPDLHTDE